MSFIGITGTLKFIALFTCRKCGKRAPGTSASVEINCGNVEEVTHQLRSASQRPQDMPVGWSSYDNGFQCKECD